MVPALNAPFASLATIALAVFALVAVVAELATLPDPAIVANLESSMAALLAMALFVMPVIVFVEPSIDLFVKVSVPSNVANTPDVGKTNVVVPVVFIVTSEAEVPLAGATVKPPLVEIAPPSVIVKLLSLATPVPPLIGLITPVMLLPFIELPEISLKVANVPEVGSVNTVVPVVFKVMSEALEPVVPEVVKFLPKVIVLPALFTPVPPLAPAITPVIWLPEILLIAVVTYCVLAIVLSLEG